MAKKFKGFGEPPQHKQGKNLDQNQLDKLQQRLEKGPLSKLFGGIVRTPKGEVKMSEVLEKFVDPYLHLANNFRQRENLFTLALVAWNTSFLPQQEQQLAINEVIKSAVKVNDSQTVQDLRDLIDDMMERKQKLFNDNKRYIVGFEFKETKNTFHLSVASTLSK